MKYFDVSARNDFNIDDLMKDLMRKAYSKNFGTGEVEERQTI